MSLNADIASVTPVEYQGDYLGNPTYNIHPNTTKHMNLKDDNSTLGESSPKGPRPLMGNPSFGRVGSVVALQDPNIDINSLHGNSKKDSSAVKLPNINNR